MSAPGGRRGMGRREWAAVAVVVPLALTALGVFVFTQPEAVMRAFGLQVEDDVAPAAFALVFRWLGVGPMLLALLVGAVAARKAAGR